MFDVSLKQTPTFHFLILYPLFPPSLEFIHAWSNLSMNNEWTDRRLSSKVPLLSQSFSCRMAAVLMQGSMHWRWAQRPPTQSVCLLVEGFSPSQAVSVASFSVRAIVHCYNQYALFFYPKHFPCLYLLCSCNHLSLFNHLLPFSLLITSAQSLSDLGIMILDLYWPSLYCLHPL